MAFSFLTSQTPSCSAISLPMFLPSGSKQSVFATSRYKNQQFFSRYLTCSSTRNSSAQTNRVFPYASLPGGHKYCQQSQHNNLWKQWSLYQHAPKLTIYSTAWMILPVKADFWWSFMSTTSINKAGSIFKAPNFNPGSCCQEAEDPETILYSLYTHLYMRYTRLSL